MKGFTIRTVLGAALLGGAMVGCHGTIGANPTSARTTAAHTRVLWVTGMT